MITILSGFCTDRRSRS